MALRLLCCTTVRVGVDLGVKNNARRFGTAAVLCRRAAPLGPMPNEDIDWRNLESLDKYRNYTRYVREAEKADRQAAWWRTYRQYCEQENSGHERVDIGLPHRRPSRKKEIRDRVKVVKENRRNTELERTARHRSFRISLDRVKDEWMVTSGPHHIKRLADHYGIYRDLFSMAYFTPHIMLHVAYGDESDATVHFGNQLTPSKAASAPQVNFKAEEGSLWTLLMTSPDEHLQDGEQEYVHWLVGNIPGNVIQSGDEVCHYMPPFPAKGTGFHRHVFILFKQEGPVDFSEDHRAPPCHCLSQRSFSTLEFYRKHQDLITPAGLVFFQCQWDESVTHTFHSVLNMREPVYQFDRPPIYHPPQRKYPHGQPLRYLDRYSDGKEQTYGIY